MKRLKKILQLGDDSTKPASALQPGFFGNFPSVFSISFAWRSDDDKSFIFFIKSEEKGREPERLYAFSISRRRSAGDSLTLYAGTNPESSPPLAYARSDKTSNSTSVITLPSREGGEATDAAHGGGSERLENSSSRLTLAELFRFQVGVGGENMAEGFEWRGGSAPERRLVRMQGGGAAWEEVVGVWTDETPSSMRGNKLGTFEFLGSGTTGELGPYWTLMAVVTLLRILEVNSAGPEALAAMSGVAGGMVLTPGVI